MRTSTARQRHGLHGELDRVDRDYSTQLGSCTIKDRTVHERTFSRTHAVASQGTCHGPLPCIAPVDLVESSGSARAHVRFRRRRGTVSRTRRAGSVPTSPPMVGAGVAGTAEREDMKLYICWSTNGSAHHDCHKAHQALVDAGHNPDLVKARGQEHLPQFLQFKVRREVHALTGSFFVPVLVLDDGTAINKPDEIVAWAQAHPAR
jgi:hypothetical protein